MYKAYLPLLKSIRSKCSLEEQIDLVKLISLVEIGPSSGDLPEFQRDGLRAYVTEGRMPGFFLECLLVGDVRLAVAHADDSNRSLIHVWLEYINATVPSIAHGSRLKVQEWSHNSGLVGLKHAIN